MRGVVSAGMVVAVEQLGLLTAFDAIYGSSAGAMNGAYLLAGQAAFGATIYYENINDSPYERAVGRWFIDFTAPLRGRPIVDLDYLVHHVMERPKWLQVDRILSSPISLHVVATHVPTAQRHVFRSWTGREDLLRSLRAGASMPIVAGPPYAYRDTYYWDALLIEPIPAAVAEEEGATHIVAFMSRPRGTAGPQTSLAERLYVLPKLAQASPAVVEGYRVRGERYAAAVRSLWSGAGVHGKAKVLPIGPTGPAVDKLERNRRKLVDGCAQGFRAMALAMGYSTSTFAELLSGYGPSGNLLSAAPAMHTEDSRIWW